MGEWHRIPAASLRKSCADSAAPCPVAPAEASSRRQSRQPRVRSQNTSSLSISYPARAQTVGNGILRQMASPLRQPLRRAETGEDHGQVGPIALHPYLFAVQPPPLRRKWAPPDLPAGGAVPSLRHRVIPLPTTSAIGGVLPRGVCLFLAGRHHAPPQGSRNPSVAKAQSPYLCLFAVSPCFFRRKWRRVKIVTGV